MALDKQAFYSQYAQVAIEQQKRYGIPASITLAQMGLESGFGTSTPARRSNNFFGVKVGSSWTGAYDYYSDDRPNEKFRRYNNVMESIEDHSKVLMKSRYSHCQNYSPTDYVSWANGIKAGGYATDPAYASKLISEINKYGLGKYDQIGIQQAQSQGLATGYARGQSSTTSVITLPPLQGNWALPIDLSVVKLSSEFGVQRPGHKHGGLDLSTQGKNYPVYATEDNGKVVAVEPNNGAAGNMIVVEYDRQDGSKVQTTYMHLSQIGVKEGEAVNAGQQIGVSGNTGRSSGPHLHFETKYLNANGNWEKFDPKLYLAEMEVRSNQATALDKNGNDALAAYRSQMQFAGGEAPSYQQQASDPTQALLASITNSNDPTKWLSLLMSNNGEDLSGRDPISSLIGSLFSAALTVAMQLRSSEEIQAEEEAESQLKQQSPGEENSNLVKMTRQDVEKAQATASMQFDAESPEQQQQQGQRLA